MRVGLFIGAAVLAGAGAAVAQSDWVVDPWSTPATEPSSDPRGYEAVDVRSTEPTDPWASSAPDASTKGTLPSAQKPPTGVSAPGAWVKPVRLVVDPWAPARVRAPASAPAAALIVDPWARDRPLR